MSKSNSLLLKGAAIAVMAAGALLATTASAESYVVCNRYDTCWKVQERYKDYPADLGVVYHDDAWWAAHQSESRWHFQTDARDGHGWYDRDGAWHAADTDHPH